MLEDTAGTNGQDVGTKGPVLTVIGVRRGETRYLEFARL